MNRQDFFAETAGCPFCAKRSTVVRDEVRYHQTAEANRSLPDVLGQLYECGDCGIAYPSHAYLPSSFPLMYSKSLADLEYLDASAIQNVRRAYITRVLEGNHRPWSLSRLLDRLSLGVLQIPITSRSPAGMRVLDIGCGFGEFLSSFRALGADVVGTEIVPSLVELNRKRGFDVRLGEIEDLDFGDRRFDLVLLRAVFYRLRTPGATLNILAERLLADGGSISLVDAAPLEAAGSKYFFHKQFPQGQFYILDAVRYHGMLKARFGLACTESRQIYGRPSAPLKKVRLLGNLLGLGELLVANILHRKPYVLAYELRRETAPSAPAQ